MVVVHAVGFLRSSGVDLSLLLDAYFFDHVGAGAEEVCYLGNPPCEII